MLFDKIAVNATILVLGRYGLSLSEMIHYIVLDFHKKKWGKILDDNLFVLDHVESGVSK